MDVGSGEQGGRGLPWIFIHDANIVDRGLKVLFFGVFLLFFGLFSPLPSPWKRLNSAIFRSFFRWIEIFYLQTPHRVIEK